MKETILFDRIEIVQNDKRTCTTCKYSENGKYGLCWVGSYIDIKRKLTDF